MGISPELYNRLIWMPYSLGIAAIIIIFCTTGSTDSHKLYALQCSYVILSCSVMFIFGLLWNKIDGVNIPLNNKLISLIPFIIIMIITFGIPILIYFNFDKITHGVSNYYTLFLNISTALTIVQLIMYFKAMKDPYFNNNNSSKSFFWSISRVSNIRLINICSTLKY